MEIYIGNISDKTTAYDLRRALNATIDTIKPGFFFWKKSEPDTLNIKIVEKHAKDGTHRYGVASVEPDEIARHCIQQLNNMFVTGQPLVAREYFQRSYMNERRAVNWREQPWSGVERRGSDRRHRYNLCNADTAAAG